MNCKHRHAWWGKRDHLFLGRWDALNEIFNKWRAKENESGHGSEDSKHDAYMYVFSLDM